jgi:hypothetical protein
VGVGGKRKEGGGGGEKERRGSGSCPSDLRVSSPCRCRSDVTREVLIACACWSVGRIRRHDFHWCEGQPSVALQLHREHQQDDLRHTWKGLMSCADGAMEWKKEQISCSNGSGESASLGNSAYRCHPTSIALSPSLDRQWQHPVWQVKVKGHTGCLLNERADEIAELGCKDDVQEVCQAKQKYAVGANACRAASVGSTIFARQLLQRPEGATTRIARVVKRCREAEYRVWINARTGRYPLHSYLHRIHMTLSPDCHFCPCPRETGTLFVCSCPKVHDVRTSGHTQGRRQIQVAWRTHLLDRWTLLEETPTKETGLQLNRVSPRAQW